MSIQNEIDRISGNVSDTLTAISEQGVEVPNTATSNDMADLVRSIEVKEHTHDTADIVAGILPIARGGTNATDRKTAIANLMVLPRNTVPVEDTPAAWAALGNCIIFYDLDSTVINKPSNYGTLIQTVSTGTATSVEQVWQRQAYGHQYYRGGNTAGWYGDANLNGIDAWHAVLDDRGGVLENPLWLRTTGIGTDDTAKLGQIQTAKGARKAFSNAAAERVGYLTITLPNGYNGGILAFDVEITDYSNSVVTYTINSQLYANSSGAHSWANGVAICSGALNSKISNLPVHMGDNGDKCQIQIGNADTQWGIGIVIIKNIRSYYNHYGASNWLNGWDISVTPTPITTVERTKDSTNKIPVTAGGTGVTSYQDLLKQLHPKSDSAPLYISTFGSGWASGGYCNPRTLRKTMGLGDTTGALPIANGGTGLTANPSMLVNLGSTSAANMLAASPRPGITGTLSIAHGGTGATTAAAARNNLGITPENIGAISAIDGGRIEGQSELLSLSSAGISCYPADMTSYASLSSSSLYISRDGISFCEISSDGIHSDDTDVIKAWRESLGIKVMTQSSYDSLSTKDANTIYMCYE